MIPPSAYKVIIKQLLILPFNSLQVETLLCLRCNSLTHGRQCGTDALSLAENSSIVVTCEGTCKVNKVTSLSGEESQYRLLQNISLFCLQVFYLYFHLDYGLSKNNLVFSFMNDFGIL